MSPPGEPPPDDVPSPESAPDEPRAEGPVAEPPDQPEQSGAPPWIGLGAFAALGTSIAFIEAVGVLGGIWADHLLHTSPWGLLLGVVLATVAAVVSVMKQVRRFL